MTHVSVDYSLGTSAHAQKGHGLLEEVLKMLNFGTVNFGQFSIRNPKHFSRTFWSKTSLTVVYDLDWSRSKFPQICIKNLNNWPYLGSYFTHRLLHIYYHNFCDLFGRWPLVNYEI